MTPSAGSEDVPGQATTAAKISVQAVAAQGIECRDDKSAGISMSFGVRQTGVAPDAIAPDGSEVRLLCQTARGSMAEFTLAPMAISRAVTHRTVDEVWYVVSGHGRILRRLGSDEEIADLAPGISVSIPLGVCFQFRCDSERAPLVVIGVTMPPWPGEEEARPVEGSWRSTV